MGHLEIVKCLVLNSCELVPKDIDVNNNWRLEINNFALQKKQPIHLACRNGHMEIVKFLSGFYKSMECMDKMVNNHYKL